MSEKKEQKEVEKFVIPAEGTLGLLALGAKGVLAWRKVRDAELAKTKTKKKDE